jgi:ABC-2 type transport system ATP-binding protein
MSDKVLVLAGGDFSNTFDLKDSTQEYIYSVEVSDKTSLIELLRAQGISCVEQGKFIKFELNEAKYRELFKQAVAKEIEFYQIKKENKFVNLIK